MEGAGWHRVASWWTAALLCCSHALIQFGAKAARVVACWRVCHRVLRHLGAWVLGEIYEDEETAFSKTRLVQNDAYRDRLLVGEIQELVDLSHALQLSIPQRRAFFRCFLHLDVLRRAGVSRNELLRYYGLRATPAAWFLLPVHDAFSVAASSHRSDSFRTQRWDVTQLLALCFALCTMTSRQVIQSCVSEIHRRLNEEAMQHRDALRSVPEYLEGEANDRLEEDGTTEELASTTSSTEVKMECDLAHQIRACLAFSYGVLSPTERALEQFVCSLYPSHSDVGDGVRMVDFRDIHGVSNLQEAASLFPVIIFPCLWTQRVLRRRVLGEVTWRKLAQRRQELHAVGLPMGSFAASAELIAFAQIAEKEKGDQGNSNDSALSTSPMDDTLYAKQITPRETTPRKVHPIGDYSTDQVDPPEPGQSLNLVARDWGEYRNLDDAWRVTANSALASALLWSEAQQGSQSYTAPPSAGEIAEQSIHISRMRYTETLEALATRSLSAPSCERIRQTLVTTYGYHFSALLFEKSSMGRVGTTQGSLALVPLKGDDGRNHARCRKAWDGIKLAEDKAIYWKEHLDPLSNCVFYHNIRTGEARWEKPITVTRRRGKKRPISGKKKCRNEPLVTADTDHAREAV